MLMAHDTYINVKMTECTSIVALQNPYLYLKAKDLLHSVVITFLLLLV